MFLEIFEKGNRTRAELIRTYNYVSYKNDLNGPGSFEIRIPIIDESLQWMQFANYILFDFGIVGVIKDVKTNVDDDTEIIVSGVLTNGILSYRSILKTEEYHNDIVTISRQLVDELFINPEDEERKISFIKLSSDEKYFPLVEEKIRYQNTGDNLLIVLSELFMPYSFGYSLYPVLQNYDKEHYANISELEFRVIKPVDRTVGNPDGNIPIVFSFELDNLNNLEYRNEGSEYCSVAIVAAEGVGQERHIIQVGDLYKTGIDRIETYVDARDLQPETFNDEEMTDEEKEAEDEKLEEKMRQRGLEKLTQSAKFVSFDGTINTGSMQYTYGVDFNLGDFVTIISKELNLQINLQITSISKSISSGVEYLDIGFGQDRLTIKELFKGKGVLYG